MMTRLLILFLTRLWGLMIIGVLVAIGGLIHGVGSHQVNFQTRQGMIAHYLSGDGTGYLELAGSSDLFIVHEQDFTPTINGTNTFADGDQVSFVYDPADKTPIDASSSRTHLVGDAGKIVQITLFDDTTGEQDFATSEYDQHPNGFYENKWPGAIIALVVGLVIIGLAFLFSILLGQSKQTNRAVPADTIYQQPDQAPAQQPQEHDSYDPTEPVNP